MRRYRLAVVASHVIQYYGPLFGRLASHPAIDLTVLFCSRRGAEPYLDHDLGVTLKWDVPLLEGYRHEFLRNLAPTQRGFFRHVNPGVIGALRRGRFDGVLVNGWGTLTMWLAYAGCMLFRIPYFVYGDNAFVIERRGLFRWVRGKLLRLLFQRAGAFLLQGTMNGDFYANYGADRRKFFLMPYAIDNGRFRERSRISSEERRQLRRALGIRDGKVVLLFSGKLIERKNPVHLLQAAERMRNREQVAVMFMGDGRERATLEAYAREHGIADVHFLGFVNQSDMPRYYALADVVVLPSSLDPRGTVTNEAMACGLPVVISNMVGIYGEGDIVRDGENGFVYPVGDNAALAEILDRLVDDAGLRQRMGVRSWEIIREWSFERDVQGVVSALEYVGNGAGERITAVQPVGRTKRYRLAVVASHVIQYYGPLFQRLAAHPWIDLNVLFCSRHGAEPYFDEQFGVRFKWDLPLLEGYRHEFLSNFAPTERGFFRRVNPGIFVALWRGRYDAVWVNGWGTMSMWFAYASCLILRIPYFVYGDTAFVMERGGVRGWIRRRVLPALFARAGGFLLQGTMNGEVHAHYGADRRRFFLVPYAVDNERFRAGSRLSDAERRQRRTELGIDPDRIVVLFSGKLLPGKNPVHLLEALRRMRNASRVAVAYMGDGSERAAIRQYADEHGMDAVHLLGFRNQTEMPEIYGLADVFVLPSSLDMRGTVTNEAMACGLPVIISNMVGVYGEGDIVRDGENGFVYPVGDNDRLASLLDRLVEDPELRRRMGERSWEIIRNWDFERDVEGVVSALQSLGGRERRLPASAAEDVARG